MEASNTKERKECHPDADSAANPKHRKMAPKMDDDLASETMIEASANETDEETLSLSSEKLGDALQRHMIGLLEHSERLHLAATCQPMHRVVENYCCAALTRIAERHNVDGTFQERIRDRSQILQVTGGGEPERDLPYRYLLHAAKRTYLYKLEMMQGGSRRISGNAVISNTGNRLVVASTRRPPFGDRNWPPIFIYSWNLDDKRCVRVDEIAAEGRDYEIKGVFLMGENIIVCTNQRILVSLADTGELIHTYSHSTKVDSVVQQDGAILVFLDQDDKVHSFDIRTGSARVVARVKVFRQGYLKCVYNSRWLVVQNCLVESRMGLRALDLCNGCRQSSFFRGSFGAMEQSRDCPNVFYSFDDPKLQVLKLSDSGRFSRVSSVRVPSVPGRFVSYYRGNFQSRIVLERYTLPAGRDRETSVVLVVRSTKDGKLERSLKLPANHFVSRVPFMIQSNGKELFVGLKLERATREDCGVIIGAYLTTEYC